MVQQISQDEKSSLLSHHSRVYQSPIPFHKRRYTIKGIVIVLLLFGWWSCYAIAPIMRARRPGTMSINDDKFFDFEDITPSEKLEWYSCFQRPFKCARLTVPMDYHRPLNVSTENPKVHIALLMVPGNHTRSQNSKSPLLLNPGGPGGSGTILALALGEYLHSVVGQDQDIIGFDPRGVGATTPRADCFSYPFDGLERSEGDDYSRGNFHRLFWQNAGRAIGNVNSSSTSLQKLDSRARTVAKLCEEKDSLSGKDSILKYVHTPSVARDMISIIDAWDEWTGSSEESSADSEAPYSKSDDEIERSHSPDTKGKLVYWGFSYGTLLGATFAAMFPDRVGRVVLDGVVDAEGYVAPVWAESIRDTDAVSDSFARYCHEARTNCLLYRPGDEVFDIQERFYNILEGLKDNPLTAIEPATKSPVIITYSDFRMLLFSTLYSPTALFPVVALIANLIYQDQQDLLAQILAPAYVVDLAPVCGSTLPSWLYPSEAQPAIMCSDKRYPLNETLPDLEIRFDKMANLSTWADVWMTVMLGCEGWRIKAIDPPMRWDDHPANKQKPIKTSHPLLFISNTADPVTPLKAGVKMAKKFVDAGLIEQRSEGHCSLAARSKCTIRKLRAYFLNGEVPPPPITSGKEWSEGNWTRCEADEWPFHPYPDHEVLAEGDFNAAAEAERMKAVREMRDAFMKMPLWGRTAPLQAVLSELASSMEASESKIESASRG